MIKGYIKIKLIKNKIRKPINLLMSRYYVNKEIKNTYQKNTSSSNSGGWQLRRLQPPLLAPHPTLGDINSRSLQFYQLTIDRNEKNPYIPVALFCTTASLIYCKHIQCKDLGGGGVYRQGDVFVLYKPCLLVKQKTRFC